MQSTLTLNVRVRFVISKKVRSFGIYRVHRAPHLNGKQNFRPLVTSVPLLSALSSEENNRPLNLRIALTALDKKKRIEKFLKILSLQLNNRLIKAKFLGNSINFIA